MNSAFGATDMSLDDWLLAESQLIQEREATDSREPSGGALARAHGRNDATRWVAPSLDRAATSSWGSCCLLYVTFADDTAGSDLNEAILMSRFDVVKLKNAARTQASASDITSCFHNEKEALFRLAFPTLTPLGPWG
jgi:hypothetical protein